MKYQAVLPLIAFAAVLCAGCVSGSSPQQAEGARGETNKSGQVRIGFSMDTLKEERWQRDKREFEQRAATLGAELTVQVANGDDKVQVQQCENLLTRGVDVLVVAPHNGEVAAAIVEAAHRQGVPVIAYDRLIRNSDVDLYLSFDNMRVGELQARYLLERAPKGNYVLIEGSQSDNNARLYREGHIKVLRPAVERGDVKIVAEQWAREWLASEALRYTEDALTRTDNDVVAVVAANDGTAGGVISALEGRGLAGQVLVSGQDAELPAVQRVVEGKQTMTVYKPIPLLARRAVEAAIALARGERVETGTTVNNGRKDVPSILLEPIIVDKSNVPETVVKDGYHKLEDVYRNVPREQWPRAQAQPGGVSYSGARLAAAFARLKPPAGAWCGGRAASVSAARSTDPDGRCFLVHKVAG